jgi:hypothetical protein
MGKLCTLSKINGNVFLIVHYFRNSPGFVCNNPRFHDSITTVLGSSCNSHGFDHSILRHGGIWGAEDEAVLYNVKIRKIPKNHPLTVISAGLLRNFQLLQTICAGGGEDPGVPRRLHTGQPQGDGSGRLVTADRGGFRTDKNRQVFPASSGRPWGDSQYRPPEATSGSRAFHGGTRPPFGLRSCGVPAAASSGSCDYGGYCRGGY